MDHGHEQAPQGRLAGSAAVRERLLNLVLGVASAVLDRIALFIDGANLFATARTLGLDIDDRRLVNEFQDRGNLLRAAYYIATTEEQGYSLMSPDELARFQRLQGRNQGDRGVRRRQADAFIDLKRLQGQNQSGSVRTMGAPRTAPSNTTATATQIQTTDDDDLHD
jgi:hypothetical protein